MNKRPFSFLRDLAKVRGQMFYHPEGGNEKELAIFQNEIDEIRDLERAGLLEVIGTPHRESMSGQLYRFDKGRANTKGCNVGFGPTF
jgi:hypothetical protein